MSFLNIIYEDANGIEGLVSVDGHNNNDLAKLFSLILKKTPLTSLSVKFDFLYEIPPDLLRIVENLLLGYASTLQRLTFLTLNKSRGEAEILNSCFRRCRFPRLTELRLYLKDAADMKTLTDITTLSALESLGFSFMKRSEQAEDLLLSVVRRITSIRKLRLGSCIKIAPEKLGDALLGRNIASLQYNYASRSPDFEGRFAEILKYCTSIRSLNVDGLPPVDSDRLTKLVVSLPLRHHVQNLVRLIERTTALRKLVLEENIKMPSDEHAFMQSLVRNTTLWCLSYAPVSQKAFSMLCEFVSLNTNLVSLSLEYSHSAHLEDEETDALARAISVNKRLRFVKLDNCVYSSAKFFDNLGDGLFSLALANGSVEDLDALLGFLRCCTSLRRLSFLNVRCDQSERLCAELTALTNLRSLKVLNSFEVPSIASFVRGNAKLCELILDRARADAAGPEELDAILRRSCLKRVFLGKSFVNTPAIVNNVLHKVGGGLKATLEPDAAIRVGSASFAVHRAVLAARSEALKELFATAAASEVQADPGLFNALLEYWYTDSLPKVSDKLGLLALTERLSPKHVPRVCCLLFCKSDFVESRMAADLNDLLRAQLYADVTLVADDGRALRAHKVVLASRSEYFRAMFASGMREARLGVVKFPQMSFKTLREIVEYLYTGMLPEPADGELLAAADMLLL